MSAYRRDWVANLPHTEIFRDQGTVGTMVGTRKRFLVALAALIMAVATVLAVSTAKASSEAEAFVQQKVDIGYEILNDESLTDEARHVQFHAFLISLTDVRRIGMFTLGQYARGATPEQTSEFIESFTDYTVAVYEDRLSQYRGQTLMVTGSIDRAADDSVVNAIVVNSNGPTPQPIRAAFRVRSDSNGDPIVIDMQIEGIWLAISQRSDFTAFLQQNSLTVLSEQLRRQTQQILSGPPQ